MVDESFGRVVIEALATGRPAVASSVGALPEILSDQWSRFLFPRGAAAPLAERLIALADWRVREPQLGPACAEWVTRRFNAQVMTDRLENLLETLRPVSTAVRTAS